MIRTGFIFALLLLGGCGNGPGESTELFSSSNTVIKCNDVSDMGDLEGLSEDQVTAKLGKPVEMSEFKLGDGLPEFRVELLNIYPLPENGNRSIKEKIWKNGSCNIAIWFTEIEGKSKSIDSLLWPDGVEF